ncbi:UDP-N-acetylmuramate dehydrogenase [Candidatus Peregrinibacteria bacterium]|nr:UDP-N-acetylmuramate dehydrogenase [Candidatus Peregrinibacteria bacterium]
MKKTIKSAFAKAFPAVLFDEKLSKYSTFQIGGPADFFYHLKENNELPALLKFCQKNHLPFFVFGGGSNILFNDKGFRGLIIKIATKNIVINKDISVTVDAGMAVAGLIKFTIEKNLSGLEKWIGLPGTVGGAVRGNAGCNGLETKRILKSAQILNTKTCKIRQVKNKYFNFKYRYSKLKKTHEIVLNATFRLKKRKISSEEQQHLIKNLQKSRISKQPFGASTGSFFKNPSTKQPAGLLIELAGLKGKTINHARISPKHANFLLNLGGAKAQDILKLARFARQTIKRKFRLTLEEEVQILSVKGPQKL